MVEIMVVVAIVLILGSATVSGSRGVIKNLRFNNSFNQLVFMVQQGRNLAITGKDKNAGSYSIKFDMDNSQKVTLFKNNLDATTTDMEVMAFLGTNGIKITSNPACTTNVVIKFISGISKTEITCGSDPPQPLIILGVQETTGDKSKTFSIHQVAGIPQVNK